MKMFSILTEKEKSELEEKILAHLNRSSRKRFWKVEIEILHCCPALSTHIHGHNYFTCESQI